MVCHDVDWGVVTGVQFWLDGVSQIIVALFGLAANGLLVFRLAR